MCVGWSMAEIEYMEMVVESMGVDKWSTVEDRKASELSL